MHAGKYHHLRVALASRGNQHESEVLSILPRDHQLTPTSKTPHSSNLRVITPYIADIHSDARAALTGQHRTFASLKSGCVNQSFILTSQFFIRSKLLTGDLIIRNHLVQDPLPKVPRDLGTGFGHLPLSLCSPIITSLLHLRHHGSDP